VRAAAAQHIFWRYTAPICYGIWNIFWFLVPEGTVKHYKFFADLASRSHPICSLRSTNAHGVSVFVLSDGKW